MNGWIEEKIEEKREKENEVEKMNVFEQIKQKCLKRKIGRSSFMEFLEVLDEVEKEQNNGWIPCKDRLPETNKYILLSFSNFSVPVVGRYEEDEDGGAFYIGDDEEPCISRLVFVNAWMELPEPYKEGEEE